MADLHKPVAIDGSININCMVISILAITQGDFLLSSKAIIENLHYSFRAG